MLRAVFLQESRSCFVVSRGYRSVLFAFLKAVFDEMAPFSDLPVIGVLFVAIGALWDDAYSLSASVAKALKIRS